MPWQRQADGMVTLKIQKAAHYTEMIHALFTVSSLARQAMVILCNKLTCDPHDTREYHG